MKIADLLIMIGAFGAAIWIDTLRASSLGLAELLGIRLKLGNFLLFIGLLIVWHWIFKAFGLYRSRRLVSASAYAFKLAQAAFLGSVAIFNVGIVFDVQLITNRFLVAFWLLSTFASVFFRLGLRAALNRVRQRGRNLNTVLIAGTNQRAIRFARRLQSQPQLGYAVAGFVDDEWLGLSAFREGGGELVANFGELKTYLRENVVDEMVIALPLCSSYQRCSRIIGLCEEQGITVRFLSDIFNLKLAKAHVEEFHGDPIITLNTGAMEGFPMAMKRLLDMALSGILLFLTAPLLLAGAVMVKATSPGKVFFVQERLGFNKRRFKMLKLRTMFSDAEERREEVAHLNEAAGPVFKIRDDPRITPVGHWLRKTSIDELPQLINVLMGDMSMVGPRPLPVCDYEGFDHDWHRRRFSVRPGLTCLWQVMHRSSVKSQFDRWMELDLEYIDRWSIWLDFVIMARTVPVVLRGQGAY